ncbi:transporter substrate-binding domain-containing diguanylate cyclase [Vibrio sp. TRT 21S02]|uniref:transporter substrate-binding domain-containing diguanylate cyclase n=1 Tax=Vibrio sp. TRT 21S02 TaxID=3418507 RepID=UPI003CED5B1C
MLRVFYAAFAVVVICFSAATFADRQTIVVTNSKSWKPFSYLDEEGKPTGILVDYWREYGEKNNVAIEFLLLDDWQQAIDAILTGKADIHAGLLWSENREAILDYGLPIISVDTQLYFNHKLVGMDVGTFLKGDHKYSVGVVNGGYEQEFISLHFPNIQLITYSNNEKLMQAAFDGDVQAFVADVQVANFYFYISDNPNRFIGVRHLYSGKLKPAVKQGNHELQQAMRVGMRKITEEDRNRVLNRWMYIQTVYPEFLVPLAIFLVVTLLVVYILTLKVSVKAKTKQLEDANKELRDLSEIDALTGVSNRRHFMNEFANLCATKQSITVIVFDIDDFKSINDTFGHSVGDVVIQRVAESVRTLTRSEHLFGRIGGEEFAVAITQSNLNQATMFAHRICHTIRGIEFENQPNLQMSVSLGCAYYENYLGPIDLNDADELMYSAKRLGKDRAVVKVIKQAGDQNVARFEAI